MNLEPEQPRSGLGMTLLLGGILSLILWGIIGILGRMFTCYAC